MATKEYAGKTVNVTDDGYLTDPSQWTREVAQAIAAEEGITLTDTHWKVIDFLKKDFAATGALASMRRINKTGGIATKDLYEMFPDGPLKKAARIAGLPRPTSCV
ncbi:MAG TPA: TusE/DsrC/DsvC family sulfur relay protein [Desulfomonilia bacterium]|jgi:dissimilatory sulfite reductase related protein|nr:TusE/DsrC/DsvC family sulfur relay protein [Desulfomonilia bacterium]